MTILSTIRQICVELKDATGKDWEVSNQHAPRNRSRVYGTVQPLTQRQIGETERSANECVENVSIVAVNQAQRQLTIAGNHLGTLFVNASIMVTGSTGNDGGYIIESLALVGSDTVVTTTAAFPIPSAVADGVVDWAYYTTTNHIVLTVRLMAYGVSGDVDRVLEPFDLLTALQNQLEGGLISLGCPIRGNNGVQDIPTPLDDQTIEPRAMLDIELGVTVAKIANTDILESVCMEASFDDTLTNPFDTHVSV